MAEASRGPYREKSLERLSSPERLDQLLRVVDQKSWLPLATLSILVLAMLVWAVVGEIPMNVQGKGILSTPRDVVEFYSPGSGYIQEIHFAVGDEIAAGDELARIQRPDLENQLELQKKKVQELTALGRAARILRPEDRDASDRSPDFESQGHIRSSQQIAERLKAEELRSVALERTRLDAQLELARSVAESLQRRLENQSGLYEEGFVSLMELNDTESDYVDSLSRVSSLENQRRNLETRELEVEDRYLIQLQRIADLAMDLEGYEQHILDVMREISALELRLRQEARIVSEHGGRILEITAAVGQYIAPGDLIGSMTRGSMENPREAVTYFTVKDGKRLEAGDEIQITPDTVERQRHGSIRGKITRVSSRPVTLTEAEKTIGNRELAASLIHAGYAMQVVAELNRDPDTVDGYEWTTSRGPEIPITAGTTTTARVSVEDRKPISFVFPFLKSTVGID